MTRPRAAGRLKRAPESFLDSQQIAQVQAGRRDFLRDALLGATAAVTSVVASKAANAAQGDPAILELTRTQQVPGPARGRARYGSPSQYEKNLQRRESPGLTRVGAASVSFAPLQGLFGIITRAACTSRGITRAGGTSIRSSTG